MLVLFNYSDFLTFLIKARRMALSEKELPNGLDSDSGAGKARSS